MIQNEQSNAGSVGQDKAAFACLTVLIFFIHSTAFFRSKNREDSLMIAVDSWAKI